jgi:hypothetical protein
LGKVEKKDHLVIVVIEHGVGELVVEKGLTFIFL